MLKATILAIGTELTQGQIVNSNAAKISMRLMNLGYEIVFHHTIPDDAAEIFAALNLCSDASDVIFITGGLGPTSDDFTRNIIADWLGAPLVFDDNSWVRIETILGQRGIPVAQSNRQQCYFPQGAQILINSAGTANGFYCRRRNKELWVLPGPPNEIATIWNDFIEAALEGRIPEAERTDLHIWSCMGISEAELGEHVQNRLAGCPYQIGYRVHTPLIDLKLWLPRNSPEATARWRKKMEEAIEPWTVSKNGSDLAKEFLDSLPPGPTAINIHDIATGGLITSRLSALISASDSSSYADRFTLVTSWAKPADFESWMIDTLRISDPSALTFAVCGPGPNGEWAVGHSSGEKTRIETANLNLQSELLKRRGRQYIGELVFLKWRQLRINQGDA